MMSSILNPLKRIKKSKTVNMYEIIRSWRSETRQEVYGSKLLHALQHVRLGSDGSGGSVVREVADRVLAIMAKGRTRWSRAILTNKFNCKSVIKSNLRRRGVIATANRKLVKKQRVGSLPAVQRKARDLRRLVPGSRKQPLLVVLEEVTDYISALDMQVKVMATVADLFSKRLDSPEL